MSLTAVLRDGPTIAYLNRHINKPNVPTFVKPTVPPGDFHAGTIGTAFELLMVQGLRNRFPSTGHVRAAERGIAFLEADWSCFPDETSDRVLEHIKPAVPVLADLGGERVPTDEHIRASIMLAHAVSFFRAPTWWAFRHWHVMDVVEREVTRAVLDEMKRMYELVPWHEFEPKERLFVNPEFGSATEALWGADADMVLDDVMLDIKTTRRCSVGIKEIRQLVCYALLGNRYGLDGEPPFDTINRVGVYLARCGQLHVFDLRECVAEQGEEAVVKMLMGWYS